MQMKTSCDERICLRLIQKVNWGDTVYLRTTKAVYDVCTVLDQSNTELTVRYVGRRWDRKKHKQYSCTIEETVNVWEIVQLRRYIDGKAINY